MKAVIYARVSTDDQDTTTQITPLKAMIEQRGEELVKIYAENETAWKAGHQKELRQLIEDARRAKFQRVYVWALDRLTREGIERMFSVIRNLQEYGVQVISYNEGWLEVPTAFTPILQALVAFVANFESARRSDRMRAWHAEKKRKGERTGRHSKAQKRQTNRPTNRGGLKRATVAV